MDLPFPMGPDRESPLPDDLPAAREEILRLRRALIADRDRLAKMAERRAGDNRAAAGTQRVLREEIAALKHLLDGSRGPGTPTARWEYLMDELQKRLPDPSPYSAAPPEGRYLEMIDGLLAFKAVHGGEACSEARAEGDGPCGACSVCVKEYRDRLPEGMKHCTIVFKECPTGHAWLTATNWVQHGCPTCEEKRLQLKLEQAVALSEGDRKRYEQERQAFIQQAEQLAAELARWKTEENEDGTPATSDCVHPELCGFCRARASMGRRDRKKLDDIRKMVTDWPCSEDCDPEEGWCECVREPLLNLVDRM